MKTANEGAGETISKYQVETVASILRLRQPALRMTFAFHRLNETAVVLVAVHAAVRTEFVFTLN